MSFALETGYVPASVPELMNIVRVNLNTHFAETYDEETFVGTNFYKFYYALIQRLQYNEVKTAEIFQRMQEYFTITNEMIQRPNTTHPGLFEYFAERGFVVSSKKPIDADAGKLYVAVDVNNAAPDYAAKKLQIANILKDITVAGVVTQGTEVTALTLSNAQSFDFKFNLPNKTAIKLKLTLDLSSNNQAIVETPEVVKARLYSNILARYHLGLDFEPQRYFSVIDAPWAASVLLEYSTNGGSTWSSAIHAANYNDLYTFALADITLVEI